METGIVSDKALASMHKARMAESSALTIIVTKIVRFEMLNISTGIHSKSTLLHVLTKCTLSAH